MRSRRRGPRYPNPLGIFPRHGWFSGLVAVSFVLGLVTAVLVVASVFVRRRGASAERRKQLAWLGYVGLLTAVWAVALIIASRGRATAPATAGSVPCSGIPDGADPGGGHSAGLRGGGAEVPAL